MKKIFVLALLLCLPISLSAQEKLTLTLEKCIKLALERNEKVLQAQERLRRAEANLKAARADRYPQVGLTSSFLQREDGDSKDKYKDYRSALSLSQLLLRFGETPYSLDKTQEDVRIASLDYERARKEVAYNVRRVFYNILLAQEEIDERRKLESAIRKKLSRVKDRKKAEILLKINVLNTELELAEQQREINELSRSFDLGKIELVQLIGEDELKEVAVVGNIPEITYTPDNAVKLALENRLDLLLLQGDIERQKRLVKEILWNRLPELRASFRYEDALLSLKQQNRTWDALFSYDVPIWERGLQQEKEGQGIGMTYPPDSSDYGGREGWELRFNFDIPIFDGFFTKEQKKSEQSELNRLSFKKKESEKTITLEVRHAYSSVASTKERVEIEQKVVEIREENLRLIETLLETVLEGEQYRSLTFDDVISARAAYTEAQRVYFQARKAHVQAQEALLRTMGVIQ